MYADAVAVKVTGRFVSVVRDIIENILREISLWATVCGLGVSSDNVAASSCVVEEASYSRV